MTRRKKLDIIMIANACLGIAGRCLFAVFSKLGMTAATDVCIIINIVLVVSAFIFCITDTYVEDDVEKAIPTEPSVCKHRMSREDFDSRIVLLRKNKLWDKAVCVNCDSAIAVDKAQAKRLLRKRAVFILCLIIAFIALTTVPYFLMDDIWAQSLSYTSIYNLLFICVIIRKLDRKTYRTLDYHALPTAEQTKSA